MLHYQHIFILAFLVCCHSFSPICLSHRRTHQAPYLQMHFEEALLGNTALTTENLKPSRYVAVNRFNVKQGSDAKFEKRWADRKSRIATLPGFRFFTLLRRVNEFGVNYDDEGSFANYISCTIWEDKESFDNWRTGDAFKEAHGGGGIGDFINLLTTALFILNGGPKPAFYESLLPLSGNSRVSFDAVGGWRKVEADGKTLLPADVFVAMNRFNIEKESEIAFEQRWKNRESTLLEYPGFIYFNMLRRDATKADDGYNYISMTIWENKEAFQNWRNSEKGSHGNAKSASSPSENASDEKKLAMKPPNAAFYEGKLALFSALGP